ncbi:family 16 glycosylhydrolase [Microvirga sp. BSC39]|uniref:family 16 glycosylhydrolase n=1 Tax=Microvirga sp. BSC39 TaxID=1549810 RepID=UPI0009DF6B89|nr:family 16 glycosylhydrolase [Microvirga sp. BSC39]
MAQYINALGVAVGNNSTVSKHFFARADQQVLSGTTGNDALWDENKAGVTLTGGVGDDTYYIKSWSTKLIEQSGGGDDTLVTWMNYVLPENIEHLSVNGDLRYGYGNSLNNIIAGGAGRQTLDGREGNDILIGGSGSDTFIVSKGNGSDVIVDFQAGAGGDVLRLMNYGFTTLASVKNAMVQVGADVRMDLGGGEVLVFRNQTISQFTADNFALSIDTSGFKLLFSEEFNTSLSLFNGTSGTWKTTYFWGDRTLSGNNEQQFYVDPSYKNLGLNPFSVADGALTITAQKASPEVQAQINNLPYTSGVITSEQSFSMQYGYFEMRAELPAGSGLWPAFWMLPINGDWPPELDIMEVLGGDPNVLHTTVHTKETGSHKSVGVASGVVDTSGGYHSYGVSWARDKITWYFDGVKVFETATPSDMHQPMYMIANLAVGGWAGTPGADTIFPAEMKIDYIRAYQLPVDHPVITQVPSSWVPLSELAFGTVNGTGAVTLWNYSNTLSATQQKVRLGNDWSRIVNGNALDNWIEGGVGQYQEYDGNGGNDVLKGGLGTDVFKIQNGDGNDTILDFSNVVGNTDKVYLDGFHFRHFEDVKPFLTQVGADVILRLDADQALKFANTTIDKFSAEQFAFFNPVSLVDDTASTTTQPLTTAKPAFNQVAVITGDIARTVVEDSGSILRTAGKLIVTDLDAGQAGVQAAILTSTLGKFVIAADGSWTYSADNAQSAIQTLNAGQQLTDTFQVRSIDGSASKTVTVTIQGVNEPFASLVTQAGTSKKDLMVGGAENNEFKGRGENDTLSGKGGNDRLWGSTGKDILTGGAGNDAFVFDTKANKKTNLDTITDFNVADDSIWLDNKIFTKLGKKGSDAAPEPLNKSFFAIDKAKDSDDYIIYNKKTGHLLYDADGSGGKYEGLEIALLKKGLGLSHKDIFVI